MAAEKDPGNSRTASDRQLFGCQTGSKFSVGLEDILHSDEQDSHGPDGLYQQRGHDPVHGGAAGGELRHLRRGIGLMEEIFQCCRKAGLNPHSVDYSLGVHGRIEKLPSEEILEVTTMCGHA